MKSLLPRNASKFELALEETLSRLERLDIPVRQVWSPYTCPAVLLPWLAHAVGVDRWSPEMPEARKRDMIAASIELYKKRGTPAALSKSLSIDGFVIELQENSHGPFTFSLHLEPKDGAGRPTRDDVESAILAAMKVKNERSHLSAVGINQSAGIDLFAGISVAVHTVTSVLIDVWQDNASTSVHGGFDLTTHQISTIQAHGAI